MQQSAISKSAMQEQLKFQEKRDTWKQIKEYVAGVAIDTDYMMQMKEKLNMDINIFGDTNMIEDTEMVVNKKEYNTAEMHEELTVKEEKGTKKHEDYWSFREMEKRHSLILKGELVSWESAIVFT